MSIDLGSLLVSFGADISGLSAGISAAKQQLTSVSSAVSDMGSQVQSHFSTLTSSISTHISTAVGDIGAKWKSISQPVGEAYNRVGEIWGNLPEHLGNIFGRITAPVTGMVNGVVGGFQHMRQAASDWMTRVSDGIGAFTTLKDAVVGTASALLAPAATAEQTSVAFTTMLHSASAAKDMIGQLSKFAADTPFESQPIDDAGAKMLAFGFKAKDVIPTLTSVGDALSALGHATGPELSSIIDVFGQMHAAGKLMTGDVDQLTSRGIPAWQMLSDAMHKPIPELQNMVSSGLIPADKAIQVLTAGMEKTFGGGMAQQSRTFNGLISTLADNWNLMLVAFGSPVLGIAEQGLTAMGNALSSPAFKEFAGRVGQAIADALKTMAGALVTLAPHVQAFAQDVAHVIQAVGSSDAFNAFVRSLQDLGSALGGTVLDLWKSFQGVLKDVFGGSGVVVNSKTVTQGLIDTLRETATVLGGLAQGIRQVTAFFESNSIQAQIVKDLMIGIGVAIATIRIGAFVATLPALIAAIPALITGFIGWATAAWGAAVATIAATWPILAIGAAIALVVAGIILAVQHWGEIAHWLQGVWGGIAGFFTNLWHGIQGVFGGIGNWFHDRFAEAHSAATAGWSGTTSFFQSVGQGIVGAWNTAVQGVVGAFSWLYNHNYYFKALVDAIIAYFVWGWNGMQTTWNAITSFLTGAWQAIAQTASSIWQAITGAVESRVHATSEAIHSAWQAVVNFMGPILSAIGSAISSAWSAVVSATATAWHAVTSAISSAWSAISGVIGGAWSTYIAGPLGALWNQVSGWFGNLAGQAIDWGRKMIQGFIDGIGSMLGSVGNAASNIAGTVAKFLGFHSPTELGPGRELDTWGVNLAKGFAESLQRGIPQIQAAVNVAVAPLGAMRPPTTLPSSSSALLVSAAAGGPQTITIMLDGRTIGQANAHYQQKQVFIRTGSM